MPKVSELTEILASKRRPASRIGRNHWHARKRRQTVLVWKNNDFDSLILLGAANRERIERAREKGTRRISKGPRFRKMNKMKEK